MQKRTHLLFAVLLFLILNKVLNFPLYVSVFALAGALLPDVDLFPRKYHRKIAHNIWFLGICLAIGFVFFDFNRMIAFALSIGYFSHLLSDSLTPMGIMPFWPFKKPKFSGPIRTGGIMEYAVALFILLGIFSLIGIIKIVIQL